MISLKPRLLGTTLLTTLICFSQAAQADACPDTTSVAKLPTIGNQGPFDPKTLTKASATYTDKGLIVFVTSSAIDAKSAAQRLPLPPVKGKGNIAISLTFQNKDGVVAGDYAPNRYGKPMHLRHSIFFGFESGGMMDSFSADQGSAKITELSGDKVCGTFELQGTSGTVAGQFTASIAK